MSKSDLIGAGIRSIAASFPVAASLAQAWSEYKTHKESERLESFMKDLALSLEKKNSSEICNEAPELLEKCIDIAVKEPTDSKILLISHLASNLVSKEINESYEGKVEYIQLIEFLNEEDLSNLKKIYPDKNIRVENMGDFQSMYSEEQDEKFGRLIFSLSKLESRGLIGESHDNLKFSTWTGDKDHWENRWRFKHFEILPAGKRLVGALQGLA